MNGINLLLTFVNEIAGPRRMPASLFSQPTYQTPERSTVNEVALAAVFCAFIAEGEVETRHGYSAGYDLHFIRVDCETASEVIEVGLDKRSSLDSVQQALFAAELTGKAPVILIIDSDGRIGPYETRIARAANRAGVEYRTLTRDFLIRWRMTSWLRSYRQAGL